jgi:cytochrome c oxidase subunit II
MFTGSSPFSDYVDATFLTIVGLSTLVLLGLVAAMIYFVIRYSHKRNPYPTNIEGNVPLEIAWTVIPIVLFMGMFYMGWEGYKKTVDVPEGAMPIQVTARMWQWTFEYPNGIKTDTLYVPVNIPMKLTLRSLDVNHSMYIPAFRIKKDAIPNKENVMWFSTPEPRSYDIACAEYCGLRHAYMYTKVVAMTSSAFEAWYREASIRAGRPVVGLPSQAATRN